MVLRETDGVDLAQSVCIFLLALGETSVLHLLLHLTGVLVFLWLLL